MLRAAAAVALVVAFAVLAACSHPAAMILSLLPDGTFSTLLSHMETVTDKNRATLAELEKKGDWRGIAEYAAVNLTKDPQNADWWIVRGFAYAQLKEFPRAAECFQEAVRAQPTEMDGWHLLAESYRAMKQPDRAVRTLDAALRINEEFAMTWFLLGESHHDLNRYDRAAQAYQQAINRDPRFVDAWYGLTVTNYRMGRKRETEEALAGLRRLDPQLAERVAAQIASAGSANPR